MSPQNLKTLSDHFSAYYHRRTLVTLIKLNEILKQKGKKSSCHFTFKFSNILYAITPRVTSRTKPPRGDSALIGGFLYSLLYQIIIKSYNPTPNKIKKSFRGDISSILI